MNRSGGAFVLALVLVTGCLTVEPEGPGSHVGVEDGAPGDTTPFSFPVIYEGFLYYRLANDGILSNGEGDPHAFCFVMPEGVDSFHASYTWDVPQRMWIEFFPETTRERVTAVGEFPPIELEVKDPSPGLWRGYGGPSSAGGMTEWRMELTFTGTGSATPDGVIVEPEAC
jgi:hypothetical protein